MPTNAHLTANAEIPATPERVWRILIDYRVHHPAILPKDVFRGLEVLEGGTGAGTRFRLTMRVGGKDHVTDISVTEPRPGKVLVEEADDGSVVTTFSLAPIDGEQATSVTFDTNYTLPAGFLFPVVRWLAGMMLRGLYRRELENLKAYVREERDLKPAG